MELIFTWAIWIFYKKSTLALYIFSFSDKNFFMKHSHFSLFFIFIFSFYYLPSSLNFEFEGNTVQAAYGGERAGSSYYEKAVVSLRVVANFRNCTAAFIDDSLLLTAAHCFENSKNELLDIPAIRLTFFESGKKSKVIKLKRKQFIIRRPYKEDPDRADHAIVELLVDMGSYGLNIHPIGTITKDQAEKEKIKDFFTIAAGFGEQARFGFLLKRVPLRLEAILSEPYGMLHFSTQGDSKLCRGDSGAPLFITTEKSDEPRIIGSLQATFLNLKMGQCSDRQLYGPLFEKALDGIDGFSL